jgi:5-methyltetrahydropteroyltriglutamate--homocysteine methyltransferase
MSLSLPVATLGVPRIGPHRELKIALERFWADKISEATLLETAARMRADSWVRQRAHGVTVVPSNDFSLYDQVLDTSLMVGAIPDVYGWRGGAAPLAVRFAMARGAATVPAEEMTKWFDTNYHYLVPEFSRGQEFVLADEKPVTEFCEAKTKGLVTRPVLVGPVTFLKLGKCREGGDAMALLPGLLPVYAAILKKLVAAGAKWVQMDEPCLSLDLSDTERAAFKRAYGMLAAAVPSLKIMLASYFGGYGDNLATAATLPVEGLHLDLVRAPEELGNALAKVPADRTLSLGCIDGRNVWRADLSAVLFRLEPVVQKRGGDGIEISPSCSLLHVPLDLSLETEMDAEVKTWCSFAVQKMDELSVLATALASGREAVKDKIAAADEAQRLRLSSPKVHDAKVAARAVAAGLEMARRTHPYAVRRRVQAEKLNLPLLPTTTIGSLPQTAEVRKARADHTAGALSDADYEAFLRRETEKAVRWQEEIGLDVLVHGEFERNDMVQYFGEKLSGFAFTRHGWVQSYGSRCVRPPIVFGDVARPAPMTVEWSVYAQSLTEKPMKGMLTGPVTMLEWSFVRDDLPRSAVCRQIALALRDEVVDLEAAGISVIQIDEPALREGLPLRGADRVEYLAWAAECFRLASSGVRDETQIHTHMCYGEFGDIIETIAAMDADVISVEAARSKMELIDVFSAFAYPNGIGPGVYDIHSPRVPETDEMATLLQKALAHIPADRLWVNPDCGLKTRRWEEVRPAIAHMVAAAGKVRPAK